MVISRCSDQPNLDNDTSEETTSEASDITESYPNVTTLPSSLGLYDDVVFTATTYTPTIDTTTFPSMSLVDENLDKDRQPHYVRRNSTHSTLSSTTKRPIYVNSAVSQYSKTSRLKRVTGSLTRLMESKYRPDPVYRQTYYGLRRKALDMTREWRIYRLRLDAYNKRIRKGLKAVRPIEPSPTPRPKPIIEDPDFNGMDPPSTPSVYQEYKRIMWKKSEMIRIRQFKGNEEVSFNDEIVYPSRDQEYSVTYVAVGTYW